MVKLPDVVHFGDDGTSDGVRVCLSGCKGPLCFDCAGSFVMRKRQEFLDACDRLLVSLVCMITITVDPKRFPNPRHVVESKVGPMVMRWFWENAPRRLRDAFPEPVYWTFVEVQDGKRGADGSTGTGNLHLHILLPAWNKTGFIPKALFAGLGALGDRLSGRTTWGWSRSQTHDGRRRKIMPIRSAAGYASKAITYCTKSDTGELVSPPAYLLDSTRLQFMTRSRAVSRDDPANVASRERESERRASDVARVSECNRLIEVALKERRYHDARQLKKVRDGDDYEKRTCVRRTHRERMARCGEKSVLFDAAGRFVSVLPIRYHSLWSEANHLFLSSGESVIPSEYTHHPDREAIDYVHKLGFWLDRPRRSFTMPQSLAAAIPAIADALHDSADSSLSRSNGMPAHKPGSVKGESVIAGRQNACGSHLVPTVSRVLKPIRVCPASNAFCRLTGSGVVLFRHATGQRANTRRATCGRKKAWVGSCLVGGGGGGPSPARGRLRRPPDLVKKSLIVNGRSASVHDPPS